MIQGTNVFLIGFMGSGKSSVGGRLARLLGYAFLDTDALIEAEVGASVAQIFAERGEAFFRRAERRAVRRVARLGHTVVALGGGAFTDRRNVEAAKGAGVVVWLRASAEAIIARLSRGADAQGGAAAGAPGVAARPLLAGRTDPERLREFVAEREPGYREAHVAVDTDGRGPDEVAREVARAVSGILSSAWPSPRVPHAGTAADGVEDRVITVAAKSATYPCHVGIGSLDRLARRLSSLAAPGRVIVVTTHLLRQLFGAALERGMRDWTSGGASITWAAVPEGERAKTLPVLARLYDVACAAGARRDCLVVALGGGTVGDLAGFFAATYLRGVRLVHVPTTLLAMVDSSIGGKVAINLRAGKNLAGAFWQPAAVVSDVATLRTLPRSELAFGLAEVVKTAVIGDPDLLDLLEGVAAAGVEDRGARRSSGRPRFAAARAFQGDPGVLREIITRSVAVKAAIVGRDERDTGERMLLNLGHTLGHAIERAGGFRRWTHGEAVSIGLAAACRASARLGLLPRDSATRVIDLLSMLDLPTSLSPTDAARLGADIESAMMRDKKARAQGLRIVLPVSIGRCVVRDDLPGEVLLREMEGRK